MGNNIRWNAPFREEIVISKNSYYCHNCNTLTNLESGTDYIYYSSGIDEDFSTQYGKHGLRKIVNDEFITWKCNKCCKINLNKATNSNPEPIIIKSREYTEIKELTKIEDKNLVKLINEFYTSKSLGLNSAATLLARKILMHIAVDQTNTEPGQKFTVYVKALKNSGLLGAKWQNKIDKIRNLGNEENHEIKIATAEELTNVSDVLKILLSSIYVE